MTWPLPALLAWGAAWGTFIGAKRWLSLAPAAALLLAAALAVAFSLGGVTRWRRLVIACGFPVSLALSGLVGELPAWAWLLPLMLLALVYPVRTWGDAPLFPTPGGALRGLGGCVPLPDGARILDAGCGLGQALIELHREYPRAELHGIEWSWPLRIACGWRARFARVTRGDIWTADWSGYDMVYVFQRPDTMARAADKAARELRPGAWLASLEFEVTSWAPARMLECPDGRRVWLYRAPFRERCGAKVSSR